MKSPEKLNELLRSENHQSEITTRMKLDFYECVMSLFKGSDLLKIIESMNNETPLPNTITKLWIQYYSHVNDLQELKERCKKAERLLL